MCLMDTDHGRMKQARDLCRHRMPPSTAFAGDQLLSAVIQLPGLLGQEFLEQATSVDPGFFLPILV